MSVAFLLIPVVLPVIPLLLHTEWLQPPSTKTRLGFGFFLFPF